MRSISLRRAGLFLATGLLVCTAHADETPAAAPAAGTSVTATASSVASAALSSSLAFVDRATTHAQDAIDQALDLLGIRYRKGGSSPEAGFDCSGFVSHVFREGMGLILPRSSKEMSRAGEEVKKSELQPGDLVFFNTMRRTFSHVGIYLGNNQFVHAPRVGGRVRVEDMNDSYWKKRFNGARRIVVE